MLFLLAILLTGCGKSASTLPPLAAIAPLSDSAVKEIVQAHKRDSLLSVWGEPLRTMDGNCGDVWQLSPEKEIIVIYDENGKVFGIWFNQ